MGDANRGAVETSQGDAAPRLLQLVEELVLELHPHRRGRLRLTLQSSLDRDLAIDSLGLAELLNRIENTFRVRLPDDLLARANTVGELLAAIGPGVAPATEVIAPVAPAPQPASTTPLDASTLTEILDRLSRERPDNLHVLFPDRTTHRSRLTYSDLAQGARSVAAGLLARGLAPGDRVALMLPTGPDFFLGFFGALYTGAVPVPIYPPLRMSQIEEHLRRQAGILNNAEAAALITMDEARTVATLLRGQVPSLRIVDTVEHLAVGQAASPPRRDDPNATVFLQYTSGSTGDPKGVVITHNNLLANLNAIRDRFGPGPSDVIVSWLPLYHDMGLIGAWLASLAFGIPAVILSPLTFLTRPQEWLWAIHRHRGTYSGGPNFGFELCLRKIPDEAIEGLDLSSLRHMANGAEPINASTIRRFTERFAKYGFRPDAMRPVYGMAENTLGLSIPLPGSVPVIDRIARDPLAKRGEAVAVAQPAGPPSGSQGATALEVVGCGPVLKGNEVRIIGSNGRELPERREGRLQFRGPSSTQGYFRNEAKTRELMDGDWRESGDLAYIAGGEIFVTGRSKDIIIRAGRNIHPHELEAAVGDIDGIRKGCVAALGIADATAGTEKIVIVAETREEDASTRAQLEDQVAATAARVSRHAARRGAARPASYGPENIERQAPPRRDEGILRARPDRVEPTRPVVATGAPQHQGVPGARTATGDGCADHPLRRLLVARGHAPALVGVFVDAGRSPARVAPSRAAGYFASRPLADGDSIDGLGSREDPEDQCRHGVQSHQLFRRARDHRRPWWAHGLRRQEGVRIAVAHRPLPSAHRQHLRRTLRRRRWSRRHREDQRRATARRPRLLFPRGDVRSQWRPASLPRRRIRSGGGSTGAGRADHDSRPSIHPAG